MNKLYLIKYGEIALKGKNRYMFEDALLRNIRRSIQKIGSFKITKEQGRILVEPKDGQYDEQEVIDKLTKVFGIIGICPVIKVDTLDFESILECLLNYMQETYEDQTLTFKVEARRSNKSYPLTSLDIARQAGAYLLNHMPNLTVDVHKPQIRVWIELRNSVYIYSEIIPGLGGMPVGTNGKAMLLLSGGIDSPVAGWMIAKRGVAIEGVYFHSHPYTSDRAKEKVVELGRKLSVYTGNFKLHVVPFTEIQMAIYEKCPHAQLTIIMRRIMMQIAEKIALKQEANALITGESIGQVASQTIESLVVTNAVCSMPIFRPLVGFDKQEIVDISEKIDTYETSILPYEDCCTIFVAKHPQTKPKLENILQSEQALENIDQMIEKAIANTEVLLVK
ncbi:MAG: tRNA 4-thiouridine(8) synthase ThiI [Epulopiscium sp.]|nr:tRNA 4-thiouridine(8) synthase ThiI [Candidatus Epulonipiscium sp.]